MKKFALAGNPNCGKTTLFNSLTGSTAHVGNWPGVTVDKKEGTYKKCKEPVQIVDLPGIYSLSPYTPEEVISRNFILDEKPDCVINIIDATNLERNLYLTTQLLEIDVPVVIALNMTDMVEKNGDKIDASLLEKNIGVPVVSISALKEEGLEALMDKAYNESLKKREGSTVLEGGALSHLIKDCKTAFTGLEVANPLFHAIKLVEMDEIETNNHKDLVKIVDEFKKTYNDSVFGTDLEAVVADQRYKYISSNFSKAYTKKHVEEGVKVETKSDKADKVLTNRWAAIPIFLVILFLIFHLTFSENFLYLGGAIKFDGPCFEGGFFEGLFYTDAGINSPGVILFNFLDSLTSGLGEVIAGWLDGAAPWVQGFINDGVVAGVFAVLSFIPQILLLFLFFSILEDTGYMARVAFILDRIFRRFGLSGRAFMPMIMGFGCSVPAMINTRTLADQKERVATVRVIPFFSCGAKLPILTACAGAICEFTSLGNADIVTYCMYLVGIVTAIICVILMRNTSMRGQTAPFIMELPAYHRPQVKSLIIHLWDKLKHYVKKAFTIILVSTIIIWFLSSFKWNWHMVSEIVDEKGEFVCYNINESILASIGQLLQPIFTPLGFGSQLSSTGWVFAVAAITGLIAKENVIATFGTLAAGLYVASHASTGNVVPADIVAMLDDEEGVSQVVQMVESTDIGWPALIAFITFNMTTIPCFAAVATAKAELPKGKMKYTVLFWLAVSYIAGTVMYLCLEFWWPIALFVVLGVGVGFAIYYYNKYKDNKKIALQ